MIIKVKAKHIRAGKQGKKEYCPIALAIKEEFNDGRLVYVHTGDVMIRFILSQYLCGILCDFPYDKTFILPTRAAQFVKRFDKNKSSVKPFNFRLNVDRPQ